ncbi:MAG: HAD-IIA family hydrolase [Candidatus Micrarchaeota archaeon]
MIRAVIFDLDGTIYIGKTPVPGAAEKIKELRSRGIKTIFLTNAATMSRKGIADRLNGMGFDVREEECYGGAYLLARYIRQEHAGKSAYVIGEKGIFEEFEKVGIKSADEADMVVAGLDRHLTYEKLARANRNLERGAIFIASNLDPTFPTEEGPMPGAGAIVAAIEKASGSAPYVVVGKPNPFVISLIEKEHGVRKAEMLMVGDRVETDMHFAKNCGIKAALVLSGVTKKEMLKEEVDYVFGSVADLKL